MKYPISCIWFSWGFLFSYCFDDSSVIKVKGKIEGDDKNKILWRRFGSQIQYCFRKGIIIEKRNGYLWAKRIFFLKLNFSNGPC